MKISAMSSEATSPTITGSPIRIIQNENRSSSLIRISGRKTTTVVSVAIVTASPTSPAPSIEAWRAATPAWRLRYMFSTITIALSTTSPRLSNSPIIVATLSDQPVK